MVCLPCGPSTETPDGWEVPVVVIFLRPFAASCSAWASNPISAHPGGQTKIVTSRDTIEVTVRSAFRCIDLPPCRKCAKSPSNSCTITMSRDRTRGAHARISRHGWPFLPCQNCLLCPKPAILIAGLRVYPDTTLIRQVPIKGLHGDILPFDRYVTLIKQEARSEQRRLMMSGRSFRQLRLWA